MQRTANATAASSPTDPKSDESHRPTWAQFGARVRHARDTAGLSHEDLALRGAYSPTLLARVETGEYEPGRALADYLDRKLDAGGRILDAWARVLISAHLTADSSVEELQRHAHQIREFQPGMVPEFLHTDGYAQALAQAARPMERSMPGNETDRARMVRFLPTGSGPPYLCAIVNEAAIRAVVGTVDTTHAQLRHLLHMARCDRVTLHVIPDGTREHPCRLGPFRCLTFSPHHTLAYAPTACGPQQFTTSARQVQGYTDLFAALHGAALPADASIGLLDDALRATQPRAITAPGTTGATGITDMVRSATATATPDY